jgi:hypothetical protein
MVGFAVVCRPLTVDDAVERGPYRTYRVGSGESVWVIVGDGFRPQSASRLQLSCVHGEPMGTPYACVPNDVPRFPSREVSFVRG